MLQDFCIWTICKRLYCISCINHSLAFLLCQLCSIWIFCVPVDNRGSSLPLLEPLVAQTAVHVVKVSSLPALEPLVRQAAVHVVKGALHIPVPVDMGLPASLLIIIEILIVSFLIRDPADLSHTVVAVIDGSPVRVSGASDVPCIFKSINKNQ